VVETLIKDLQQLVVAFSGGSGQVGGKRGDTLNAVMINVRFPTRCVVAHLIVVVLPGGIEDIQALESRIRNTGGRWLCRHFGVDIRRGSRAETLFRMVSAGGRLSGGGM
jgi:hypothetical protein